MTTEEINDIKQLLNELEQIADTLETVENNELDNMEGASAPEFFIYDAIHGGVGSAKSMIRGTVVQVRKKLKEARK